MKILSVTEVAGSFSSVMDGAEFEQEDRCPSS